MVKSIKRFLIKIALHGIRSILWVIKVHKERNDKSRIPQEHIQNKTVQYQEKNEPQYLSEAHKKSSMDKQATIKGWQESPTDWKEIDDQIDESFRVHGQKNPNKKFKSFDYNTLTRKELDTLYHRIIDKAIENYEYRLHVLFIWKINHEQFHYRAAASLATRIRREEQRMKKHDIIGSYFKKRWANMTSEEVEADRKWMVNQGRFRNSN
ncbi:hypothetical protein [Muricauda brasiliensis]|uniref:hypothetical protein n=1 Tax=Muricauda brasiliensis TaxID=2162892 RepID=UPI000D398F70|nr:hypothetical protein [Muricauda brasiliensis]